jgi:hypothetical protein
MTLPSKAIDAAIAPPRASVVAEAQQQSLLILLRQIVE